MKVLSGKKWPGDRDSNPRMLSHQRFSRPPLSTAQPSPDNTIKKSYSVFSFTQEAPSWIFSFVHSPAFLVSSTTPFAVFEQDTKNKHANNAKEKNFTQILLEATPRFELGIKDLQSHALAAWLCRQKLSCDFSKQKLNFAWNFAIIAKNFKGQKWKSY